MVSHPADNMVSKLNNTKGATVGSVIAEMGWMNLFTRGLPLRILMVGTLTGLQWGIYDAYKVRRQGPAWSDLCICCWRDARLVQLLQGRPPLAATHLAGQCGGRLFSAEQQLGKCLACCLTATLSQHQGRTGFVCECGVQGSVLH